MVILGKDLNMILKNQYCHYLLQSQVNYTCTHMAEHIEVSHDKITRFLSNNIMDERYFYEQLYLDQTLPFGGYLVFDDTVLDKSHSHKIEMVRRQYSGNAGGIIKGIGVVNMLYYLPDLGKSYLLGFRFFDPDLDNKTKVNHVSEMIVQAESYSVGYQGVLMDTWYAVAGLFQLVNSYGKHFYCPIKSNRLVKDNDQSYYKTMGDLSWTQKDLVQGKALKVKNLNMDVKAFKVAVSTNRTDYVLTNDLGKLDIDKIKKIQKIRWKIDGAARAVFTSRTKGTYWY